MAIIKELNLYNSTHPPTTTDMKKKDKWFGKCRRCGKERHLSTVQAGNGGTYTIWLRRMCDYCRYKTFYHFYVGLGYKEYAKLYKGLVEKYRPSQDDNQKS